MNLQERIERSRSTERIDFSRYGSRGQDDPLVKVRSGDALIVAPNWTIPGDFEGGMYADYIAEHPEYDGVYVRAGLLERLERAASALPGSHRLVVRAGHRPIAVQRRLLSECAADYQRDNPGTGDEEALEHARTFVSDPDITIPPHVCGAAVDVEIEDASTGRYLDFGGSMNDDCDRSFLYYPDLSAEQKANRAMLVRVMLGAGLASCMTEWWHFSYGDQIWAWFYGEEHSLYSPVDL